MVDGSKRFLNAFVSIERQLQTMLGADRYVPFYQLVDRVATTSRAVRSFKDDLKEYADLRNAIVHERSGGHLIAEPNERAVEHIERIADLIRDTPKVVPKFQRSVTSLSPTDSTADAVALMRRESYSQLPIAHGGEFVALLTANTIARWLGASVADDVFSLNETRIETVLQFTEDEENHAFLKRSATLFDALELFHQFDDRGKRLDAILLTHAGSPREQMIGIITVSDLPAIIEAVG
jgi:CBS domain-containing protein